MHTAPRDLTVDRLADPAEPAQVAWVEGMGVHAADRREPHRHDYHELIWIRSGSGRHLIDGAPLPIEEGTVTIIGRGQVHVFEEGEDLHGAVLRLRDELLPGDSQRLPAGWMLSGRCGRSVPVPEDQADQFEALLRALDDELKRPTGPESSQLLGHLNSVVLLWLERWYDASREEQPDPDEAQVKLLRRFIRVLERDYARHHDAAHYAAELRVPPAALSRALTQVTGKGTKELVLDRVMSEAARLLRFTDLTVQQVALRVGYDDPLYFSRALKRHFGDSPMAYRAQSRGRPVPS
ncbi:MAG TPA: AraC family transcriptional regulator [Thermoleophilaceae bacterium]|nr:AraC family transcriptional regulator [Thermoleophilaceae bacterium]